MSIRLTDRYDPPHALPDRRKGAAITWPREAYDLTGDHNIMTILDDLRATADECAELRRRWMRWTLAATGCLALFAPLLAWAWGWL